MGTRGLRSSVGMRFLGSMLAFEVWINHGGGRSESDRFGCSTNQRSLVRLIELMHATHNPYRGSLSFKILQVNLDSMPTSPMNASGSWGASVIMYELDDCEPASQLTTDCRWRRSAPNGGPDKTERVQYLCTYNTATLLMIVRNPEIPYHRLGLPGRQAVGRIAESLSLSDEDKGVVRYSLGNHTNHSFLFDIHLYGKILIILLGKSLRQSLLSCYKVGKGTNY